jgi:hypothetical protein
MNPLQLRKQQLLALSELNRSQMMVEVAALRGAIHSVGSREQPFGLIVSSVATLVTGLAAHQRDTESGPSRKPGWGQSLLRGAGLVCTLWLALRPRHDSPKS